MYALLTALDYNKGSDKEIDEYPQTLFESVLDYTRLFKIYSPRCDRAAAIMVDALDG